MTGKSWRASGSRANGSAGKLGDSFIGIIYNPNISLSNGTKFVKKYFSQKMLSACDSCLTEHLHEMFLHFRWHSNSCWKLFSFPWQPVYYKKEGKISFFLSIKPLKKPGTSHTVARQHCTNSG
jgi:hypothetical protein